MEAWLTAQFENDGVEISWPTEYGTTQYTSIGWMTEHFGTKRLTKSEMLAASPTDGWRDIIERWDDLGKFN